MAAGHGGARPGAGRKPKADKFKRQITRADKTIVGDLDVRVRTLTQIADGNYPIEEEVWKPAALVIVDATEIVETDKGAVSVKIKTPAFPNLPPDEMVLVEKRISVAAPDLKANVYLVNRIMGSPSRQPDEEEAIAATGPLYDLSQLTDEELDVFQTLAAKCSLAKRDGGGEGEA